MNIIQRIRVFLLKHYKGVSKLFFAGALITLILYEARHQLQGIHLASSLHTIRTIPVQWLLLFAVLGIIASMSMVFYDVFALKNLKSKIEIKDLFSISFVSNVLNALFGFGGITGISVKKLLFKTRYIEPEEVACYHNVLALSTVTGLSFLSIFTFFHLHSISFIIEQHQWVLLCLLLASLYLPAYFFLDRLVKGCRLWPEIFGASKLFILRVQLLTVSTGEWLLTSVLFYALVHYYNTEISYINTLSIFVIASIIGLLSFLPCGIGAFDLIAVIALQMMGLTASQAIVVAILYRVFYYFIPAGVAILVFSLQVLNRTEQKGYAIKSDAYGQLIATIMATIVLMCSLVLLISGLTPGLISRSKLIADLTSITFLQYSRSISIAVGFMLLITAKEIFFRVKRAYHATMLLFLIGGIFTFIKGLDFEEFIFILISMGVLRLSKTNFYRKSVLTKPSHFIAASLSVLALLIVHLKISHSLFFHYIKIFHYPHLGFHHIHTFIHSGIVVYSLFLLFMIVWYIKREGIDEDARFEGADEKKLKEFFAKYKGHHLSHLIYLGDKNLFWAADGQVLIAYSRYSDKAIVLGDPMGEPALFSQGIQEFQQFIDLYGYKAAFYEVEESNMSMYHDNGFYFFKLGEEAVVDLSCFEMLGSNRRTFRNTVNRFAKDGYEFEVLYPPFRDEFLEELEQISSEWLGKRKEMGFCVGWFNRDYLQQSPIAVVKRSADQEIIAFVSLTYHDQQRETIGIDLMRFKNNVPNSTMDFIFIRLLMYFKEEGYHYFSFSVAPLSQVGAGPKAHLAEKVAHFVYKHGRLIYSFEGLRKFKNKFDPDWAPMYLAYPQFVSLAALLIEISLLVNKTKAKSLKDSN
ncbi:bifunctional lysylphosphatidylglycerol flippase/synthetase MprF [Clostridium aminobutyricum]|uniref:Phosphatidylglycerol lysyltransferase n=1 Tax=Clostridium aminobutyricum TaxID=33953 RepID=A0A939D8Z9_CLOAM|nr:bifunctional lysylphosphatidylglycerol flippase/synthetase MprF [Clostridium aminobutyricum]MBN7773272.1 bifunctional lysylphosphatidylglycerol flippase/synthetase MprF [Clostridium aminobutyricum]